VTIEADVGMTFFKEEGRSNWVKGCRQTPSDVKARKQMWPKSSLK
jgi:hypothetical protein